MYIGAKKKDGFRHWQLVIDIIAILFGILTIVLAILIFCRLNDRIQWLPLMFLLASLVNLISGMKSLYYGRRLSGAGLCICACVVLAFAVVSYVTFWL